MKTLSTSKLAKKLGMSSKELFQHLNDKNWIYRDDSGWTLTREGRLVGGDTANNPKYGEFVVWPETLDINQSVSVGEMLNATKIGEHFDLSARKVNLFLSDIGWIDKHNGGWVLTDLGKSNGGAQMEASNGAPYILWSSELLQNKHLLREIKEASGDEHTLEEEVKEIQSDDFRQKYPAQHRTQDGHMVRSRAELLIDNFLYTNQITHAYERKLNIDETVYCDFYIPSAKLYIEYWGMEENTRYAQRKKKKLEIYAKYGFKLISLDDNDILNLDERFSAKLRKYGIVVD